MKITQEELQLRWEALTLADDFLFGKVMSNVSLCGEMLHRIFPNLDVSNMKPVDTQKTMKLGLHLRGVRFDVFARVSRNIFDIEMQKRKLNDLQKRPRAYHTVICHDALKRTSLKKSGSYRDLPETYVVFICTFDMFGKGRHIYSFQNYCTEDKNITLDDGGYTVFLNTKGKMNDVSAELKRFLDFVENNKVNDEDAFIRELDTQIKEAKENTKWRNEFMLLLTEIDEKRAEAREEGLNEGIAIGEKRGEERASKSIFEKLIASGMDRLQAASITGISL